MNAAIFEEQLRSILDEFNQLKNRSQHDDLSDLPKDDRQAVVTRAIAAIHRIAGRDSAYVKEVNRLLQSMPLLHVHTTSIMGVAKAVLDDIQAGYLLGLVEIVHADVFSDFLDMAKHLCDSGYKDASAVIAGSTLETHLRALCQKAGIPVEITKTNGDLVPKKADAMNSDLAAATVYSKLDQKNVTAWLDLRNKSAHGYYSEYTQDQAALLITGVRDFITRNPA